MATYTTNYNLKKPAETDFILVGDFNDNADIIDAELKKRPVIGEDGKLSDDLLPDLAATYEPKGAADSAVSAHNTSTNAHQDIRQAIKDKQDALAFDTTPTEGSINPVTSGGVYTALSKKQDASTAITTSNIGNQTVNKAKYATDTIAVGTAALRNQYFVSAEATPTVNGQIAWVYG